MRKNIQYNILAFISMLMVFLFLSLLGQHFGIGSKTDTYFFSLMIIGYLNYFIQASWVAMQPYYIKCKVENLKSASILYSSLLNRILFFSLLIILLYFLVSNYLINLDIKQKEFLDIFIFYIFVQNILLFNKSILNLEEYFASYYLVDIFIYTLNILTLLLFVENDIRLIAYSMIIGTTIAVSGQFYLIFYQISITYSYKQKHSEIRNIYKNSMKLKLSSLLYGLKEPLLAIIFLSLGEGVYSIFNYAHKFSAALFQITTIPTMTRLLTKIHYLIAEKKYILIQHTINKTLFETVPLFLVGSITFYFLMPYTMPLFFNKVLTVNNLKTMQLFYLYMSLFYLIIVVESPFASTISAFKLFNYQLGINILFFLFLGTIYILFSWTSIHYFNYLVILILAQSINLFLYTYKHQTYLKGKQ